MILRDFLFLDERAVSQYLEQLEGGAYDEESIRHQGEKGSTFGGGARVGSLEARAERKAVNNEERSAVVRQTPSSRFSRFHGLVSDADLLQELPNLDEDIWSQLEVGEMVEVSASLTIPDVVKGLDMVQSAQSLLPIVSAFNDLMPNDQRIDRQELATVQDQMPVVSGMANQLAQRAVPCIVKVAVNPRFQFFTKLPRESLNVPDIERLDGEATVLGKIQRILGKRDSISIDAEVAGITLPRAQRRKQAASSSQEIGHPAAVLTPIAIWR